MVLEQGPKIYVLAMDKYHWSTRLLTQHIIASDQVLLSIFSIGPGDKAKDKKMVIECSIPQLC